MVDAPPPQPLGTVITGPPAQAITHVIVSAQKPEPPVGHDLVASLVGALVGGAIAAGVQRYSAGLQEAAQRRAHATEVRERAAQRRELEAATAFSVITKATRAATTIFRIHDAIHDGRVVSLRTRGTLVGTILASLSDDKVIEFTTEELRLIQVSCKGRLLDRVLNLPYVQAMYVDFMRTYRDGRAKIPEFMSSNELGADGVSLTTFQGVNAYRVEVVEHELTRLLEQMLLWSPYDRAYSHNVVYDLYRLYVERFSAPELHLQMEIGRLSEPLDPRQRKTARK